MKSDIKQEWVKRLRSGIPQTKGILALGDARCAFGVLCDTAVEHGIIDRTTTSGFTVYGNSSKHICWLPDEVLHWSGITATDAYRIATLNDKGSTFEEIATYIEENL